VKRREPDLEPELEAFLEQRPIARHAPPELRARVLARAKVIAAAGGAIPAAPIVPSRAPSWTAAARGGGRLRIAVAASIAIAAVAAGAVAALHRQSASAPRVAAPPSAPVLNARPAPVESPARHDEPAPSPSPSPSPSIVRPRAARSVPKGDLFTAELELLQRAHTAYTQREFSLALTLIAEHARRFPKARLAEQREALRVRSLAGAGRADEAHRAAAAFAAQFPRSVLLPRVDGASAEP
jgi:hypothetical protein